MPNWTTNTIYGKKAVLQRYIVEDEDYFDFNKLIPMPQSLDVESGTNSFEGLIALAIAKPEEYSAINRAWKTLNLFNKELKTEPKYLEALKDPDFKKNDFEDKCAFGQILLDNYSAYGSCDWYDWRCKHWGTKWNATDCYIEDWDEDLLKITFSTAWAAPLPIFKKLIKSNPDQGFVFEWQNEDGCETHYFMMPSDDEILSIDEECSEDGDMLNEEEIEIFRDNLLRQEGLVH